MVKEVILPSRPHFDVIVALWLLLRRGQEKFPGLADAKISYWTRSEPPTADELTHWKQDGKIGLDVGGGEFDHHEKADSTTELVAGYLGIAEKPELQILLDYVRQDEQAGLHNRYGELPAIVKALIAQEKPLVQITKLVFPILDALQFKEESFYVTAAKEFEAKAKIYKIKHRGKMIKVATIESDDPQVARFGRMQKIALVVQRRSTGHIMISSNKVARLDLEPVIRALRLREMRLKGTDDTKVPESWLIREGSIPQVTHWYYHKGLASIYNGTDAMFNTPATALTLDDVFNICVAMLADDRQYKPAT